MNNFRTHEISKERYHGGALLRGQLVAASESMSVASNQRVRRNSIRIASQGRKNKTRTIIFTMPIPP